MARDSTNDGSTVGLTRTTDPGAITSLPDPDPLAARARAYVLAAKAPSTLRAYRCDWQHFAAWCELRQVQAFPAVPATVALYLAALAGPGPRDRGVPLAGHAQACRVSETLKGIKRVHGAAQAGNAPLVTADLQKLVAHIGAARSGIAAKCCCWSATAEASGGRSCRRSKSAI